MFRNSFIIFGAATCLLFATASWFGFGIFDWGAALHKGPAPSNVYHK